MTVRDDDVNQVLREASEYFHQAGARDDDADRRNRDLVRVHEQGWKTVAQSISEGFRLVAKAIEQHGRR